MSTPWNLSGHLSCLFYIRVRIRFEVSVDFQAGVRVRIVIGVRVAVGARFGVRVGNWFGCRLGNRVGVNLMWLSYRPGGPHFETISTGIKYNERV